MKFKIIVIEKSKVDGLPCFTAQIMDPPFHYLVSTGQTEIEAVRRIKDKIAESLDVQGIKSLTTVEVDIP